MEKNVLIVIPPKDYQDEEYKLVTEGLDQVGASYKTTSISAGDCFSMNNSVTTVDQSISGSDFSDYEMLILIGGSGINELLGDPDIMSLIREFAGSDRYITALGWSVSFLATARIISGKKLTGSKQIKALVEEGEGVFSNAPVETDGKIITGSGLESIEEYVEKICAILEG